MSRLPYFKFMVDDWLGGMITTHDMATQGVFVNICARAWKNGGGVTSDVDKLARILRCDKQMLSNCLDLLISDGLLVEAKEANASLLVVKFLNEQLRNSEQLSIKRSDAGRKGGLANAKQLLSKGEAFSDPDPEPDPEPDLNKISPCPVETGHEEATIVEIPLVGGKSFAVTQFYIDEMQALYPGVDVQNEMRAIAAWNLSNPKNRKTKNGIMRHINSWLARSQNKSSPGKSRSNSTEDDLSWMPRTTN